MALLQLVPLFFIAQPGFAQSQCETRFVEKCQQMKDAAGAYQPSVSANGGAKALTEAQQRAFLDTAGAWESVRNSCVKQRKECEQTCAQQAVQCREKLNPMIHEANTQMTTNNDRAAQAAAGAATQDDMSSDQARREAASERYGEDAKVEKTGNLYTDTYVCKDSTQCFDPVSGETLTLNGNGSLTVQPSGGYGGYTVLRPKFDAAGFPIK